MSSPNGSAVQRRGPRDIVTHRENAGGPRPLLARVSRRVFFLRFLGDSFLNPEIQKCFCRNTVRSSGRPYLFSESTLQWKVDGRTAKVHLELSWCRLIAHLMLIPVLADFKIRA